MIDVELAIALEESRRQALLAGDVQALHNLLADELSYVHSSGGRDDKASYLAKMASGKLKYLELQFSHQSAQVLGPVAVVTGRMAAQVTIDGQAKTVASQFLTVWARDASGQWRLHAHQGTPLPAV